GEIIIEAVIAGSALYLFLVHTFTADAPFLKPALFRDPNFAAGTLFVASVGISVVNAMLTQNTQANHAAIASHVTAVNRGFEQPTILQFWNPLTAAGRAALDAVITQQAQIIAYIDDYKLLMIATLAVIPLLMVFRRSSSGGAAQHIAAAK